MNRVQDAPTLLNLMTVRSALSAAGPSSSADQVSAQPLSWMIQAMAVLLVTTMTAAAAQISVPLPFTPVPFTFQPMVVLIGGAALGARLGLASQVLYLLIGIAGLPVFAASPVLPQGVARLFGPTAGFLLSYPLAAWVTGTLAERQFDRKYLTSVLAMAAGLVVVFAGGTLRLAYGPPQPMGLAAALQIAVVPFVPADIVKVCLAAAVMPTLWRFLGRDVPRT
jgi:biotin transport system substrate-specific component